MVDYWNTNIEENPRCSHGPSLLFSRKSRPSDKFYACAAFRDRKKCSFYRRFSDGVELRETTSNSPVSKQFEYIDDSRTKNYRDCGRRVSSVRKRSLRDDDVEKYSYCRHCELLLIQKSNDRIDGNYVNNANALCLVSNVEQSDSKLMNGSGQKLDHISHIIDGPFDRDRLSRPSTIIEARTDAKAESQYFFSSNTTEFFADILRQQNITAVLCIGCPRLHEYLSTTTLNLIKTEKNYPLRSMLLDIDSRYLQFYNEREFQLFNMFNCHFFDANGWKRVKAFCEDNRIALVVDPPFGGRIEALAYTLNRLVERINEQDDTIEKEDNVVSSSDIVVLLIMPYFMESHIRKHMPSFSMLDYKVEYENHKKFRFRAQLGVNNDQNKGSAIRVFVNIDRSSFKLSPKFGYKYCDMCARWVYRANKHCNKCGDCTSKNGGKYKHCDVCRKCVKITWKHCKTCRICKLKEHICSLRPSLDNPSPVKCKRVFRMKRKRNRKKRENVSKQLRPNVCDRNN